MTKIQIFAIILLETNTNMMEIMTEELENMKYENMNVKDWLAEAVDLGGCLIENVSKTVCKLIYCDGKLSHVHYRNEVIEIDWDNSIPNYRAGSVLIFGWNEYRDYCVYRFHVVIPFIK